MAGVRRTVKMRRQSNRSKADGSTSMLSAVQHAKLYDRGENAGIATRDSDRGTNAATADSGENEARRMNMRECEDAIMEDTASRRG